MGTGTNTDKIENPVESGFGRRRLTINTISSLVHFTLLMGIGLWYTPFMLQRVPESVYGLVPLATSLTNHMVMMLAIITGPVCRFVSADLLRGDIEFANATFNSYLFSGLKIVGLLGGLVVIFCSILPVNVPAGHETIARLLFLSIGFSFLISSISSCFEVGYWVTHRFEIRSLVEILVLLVRNGSVVGLFCLSSPDIWQIAVAVMVAAVFQLAMVYTVWKKLVPHLRIDRHAQTSASKALIYSVGKWLILMHWGIQLLNNTDLFLINRFFGNEDNTKYGVVLLAAAIVRSVFSSLGLILIPAMVTLEATGSNRDLGLGTARALRVFGALAGHATGILAGLALPLLTIWIKKPWIQEVAPLSIFVLLIVTYEMYVLPVTPLLIAPERIKRYAIGSACSGIAAVILAVFLLWSTDLHFYAIAIPYCLAAIFKNGIYNPILAADGLDVPRYQFATIGIPVLIRFGLTMFLSRAIGNWMNPDDLTSLLTCMVLTVIIALPFSILALPREDRKIMLEFAAPMYTS